MDINDTVSIQTVNVELGMAADRASPVVLVLDQTFGALRLVVVADDNSSTSALELVEPRIYAITAGGNGEYDVVGMQGDSWPEDAENKWEERTHRTNA